MTETKVQKTVDLEIGSTTRFVFKDEISRIKDDERRKCIRSILYILELLMSKDTDDYAKARKAVLDFVNDYDRSIDILLEKVML